MRTGFHNATIPWERSAMPFPRRVVLTLRAVLLHPLQTFRDVGPGDAAPAFGFAVLASIPGFVFNLAHTVLEEGKLDVEFALQAIMHSMAVVTLGSFMVSGVFHLLFRMLGRAGNFSHLLRAVCYAQAPVVILSLFEFAELISLALVAVIVEAIYFGLAAFAVGRSTYFLSTAKAVIALLVGPLLLGALFGILLVQSNLDLQLSTPARPAQQRSTNAAPATPP